MPDRGMTATARHALVAKMDEALRLQGFDPSKTPGENFLAVNSALQEVIEALPGLDDAILGTASICWVPRMMQTRHENERANTERITGVALRAGTRTWTRAAPARHGDILASAGRMGASAEQGFSTSKRVFVGRTEAMVLALASGQVLSEKLRPGQECLFSEDLW